MSHNIFSNILNPYVKGLYNQAIDSLLSDNGLSVKCTFKYTGTNTTYCTNCIIDPLSGMSANKYNDVGPVPFAESTICPVCMGIGSIIDKNASEVHNLICVFDSKYWLNWASDSVNVPNNMMQTISSISLLSKIRAVKEIVIDPSLSKYGNYVYERAGDPTPVGLDPNKYCFTMWKKK